MGVYPLPLTSSYAYVVACWSRLGRIDTLCSFGQATCPDLRADDVIPVHDDAQLHKAHRTRNLLQNVGRETIGFLPFCPDFTPSDFYLFPTLKEYLSGHRLTSDEDDTVLLSLSVTGPYFLHAVTSASTVKGIMSKNSEPVAPTFIVGQIPLLTTCLWFMGRPTVD